MTSISNECIVIANNTMSNKISELIEPEYCCRIYTHIDDLSESLFDNVDTLCVIIYISNSNFEFVRTIIERIKNNNPFPVISIIQGLDMEIARLCGKIGIDKFIERHDLSRLKEVISDIIHQKKHTILLSSFGINIDKYPLSIKKALRYLEENYISIMSVSFIAEYVGVRESTMSRLFRKGNLLSPKKLLMQFKLTHAVHLMKTGTLSLKKVAEYSGFSCEKRLNDCFNSRYNQSANKYRKNVRIKINSADIGIYF